MSITGTIDSILHHKSGGNLWSVAPEATVFEAIQLMADKNIGALPVIKDGRIVGIFSERDYTRKIALKGKSSKQTPVHEILSATIISAAPGSTVEECMRLMTEHRVRHLPVLKGDQLIGIVSIGDLVNWIISTQNATIAQMEQYISGGYPT